MADQTRSVEVLRQDTPPCGVVDLIFRMWLSLTTERAAQVAMILLAAGFGVLLVLGGVALMAHIVFGALTVMSAGGLAVAGTGLAATGYGIVRHYRGRPAPQRGGRLRS